MSRVSAARTWLGQQLAKYGRGQTQREQLGDLMRRARELGEVGRYFKAVSKTPWLPALAGTIEHVTQRGEAARIRSEPLALRDQIDEQLKALQALRQFMLSVEDIFGDAQTTSPNGDGS